METVVRVVLIYLFILAGLRILGKRELSQLSPAELVAIVLVSELAQDALNRNDFSITNAVIGISTLFSLVFLISLFAHRFKPFEQVVEDVPTVLVQRGKFVESNMNKERIPPDEVYAEMHKSGLEQLSQVKWAVLESDGQISFIPENPEDQGKSKPQEKKETS